MSSSVSPPSARSRRFHVTRTDVVLSVISALLEAAGVAYFVHRKGWFRA